MTRFMSGVALGIFIGITASAYAAGIFGSGTLTGWTVTKDGEEVCSDPDVDTAAREIGAPGAIGTDGKKEKGPQAGPFGRS